MLCTYFWKLTYYTRNEIFVIKWLVEEDLPNDANSFTKYTIHPSVTLMKGIFNGGNEEIANTVCL